MQGAGAHREGITPSAWLPSPDKILQRRRNLRNPTPHRNAFKCTVCRSNEHEWDSCPFHISAAYTERDILHYALLHDISHPYRAEVENNCGANQQCLTTRAAPRSGVKEAAVVCLDSGASMHFSSITALTDHGTPTDPTSEPPIRSATGEARVEKIADIKIRVFPIDGDGSPCTPLDIAQQMRLLSSMEKNLTLISAGTILAKITELYPGRPGEYNSPQINLKSESNGSWSRLTYFDVRADKYLHIPIKERNGVYFMKCSFMHNDKVLISGNTPPDVGSEQALTNIPKVKMSRPVLKVTLTQLHYRLIHLSDRVLRKFAEYYPFFFRVF